jgi:hypothetical protein
MRKRATVFFLLSYLLIPPPGPAGSSDGGFAGEEIILEGLALSYQLRFDEALGVFRKLESKYPGSPASAFYPAAVTWGYVESDLRWRRIAELHAKTDVAKKFSADSAERLLRDMKRTITTCNKILERNEDDFEAMFYLAGAHGFASRMEFFRSNYLSAMLHARHSAKGFELLLEKHPEKGDALLGPGVYKYFVGRLSPAIRFIVSLQGLSGSKEEGLLLIETAYRDSTLSAMESADFLAMIHGRFEKDFASGLFWADMLEKENQASPLANYHRLLICHLSGDRICEEKAALALKEKMKPVADGLKNGWGNLLDYTVGAIREENGDTGSAKGYFIKAYNSPDLDPWLGRELRYRLDIEG